MLLSGQPALGALLAVAISLLGAEARDVSPVRRTVRIPWLNYEGLESAARDAISHAHTRRGVANSFANLIAREPNNDNGYHSSTPRCDSVKKRKEWRQLSRGEKKDYIRAIKCLQTKPDYGISPVTDNLYDAFVQVHQTIWFDFHGNSQFLPWHRWYVWIHAEAMTYECGYNGPVPYWDYTLDYKNPGGSPIFSKDPEIGFGTHGTIVRNEIGLGGFQVDNGAFANFTVTLPKPHFLTRNFTAWKTADPLGLYGYQLGESYSPKAVQKVLEAPTFWDLEIGIDGLNMTAVDNGENFIPIAGIHNAPHAFSMGDWNGPTWLLGTEWFPAGVVAPNDPMFWPHHANVDRNFWKWQQKPGKQWEYNGRKNLTDPESHALPTDKLPFYDLGPNPPVALTLKTENWPMCYTY